MFLEKGNAMCIDQNDAIKFQTRLMLGGTRYDMVKKANNKNDVIIVCLRCGWNDAFRHVSRNQENLDKSSVEQCILKEILGSDVFLNFFTEYAKADTTDAKVDIINNNFESIKDLISKVKNVDDKDYPLSFGHIQKIINIAIKLYFCLYALKEEIGIDEAHFCKEILHDKQDCPIDSIILGKLDKKINDEGSEEIKKLRDGCPNKKFAGLVWSGLGRHDSEDPKYDIENYKKAQKAMRELGYKNALRFDFDNW